MRDTNIVVVGGRLTRNPELRFTPNGKGIAKLGLAVGESWKNKETGEKQEKTTFVDIDIFGPTAEYAGKACFKGQRIQVQGKLKMDVWEDKNTGAKRTRLSVECRELQIIDYRQDGDGNQPQNQGQQPAQAATQTSGDDVPW